MSSEKKKTLITIIGITVIVVATIIMLPFGNVIYNCGQIKEAKNIYNQGVETNNKKVLTHIRKTYRIL